MKKGVVMRRIAVLDDEKSYLDSVLALLEEYEVYITRIAHGLPFGADISYADEMTLLKAIEGRRKY